MSKSAQYICLSLCGTQCLQRQNQVSVLVQLFSWCLVSYFDPFKGFLIVCIILY
jgi:hypothetical protein